METVLTNGTVLVSILIPSCFLLIDFTIRLFIKKLSIKGMTTDLFSLSLGINLSLISYILEFQNTQFLFQIVTLLFYLVLLWILSICLESIDLNRIVHQLEGKTESVFFRLKTKTIHESRALEATESLIITEQCSKQKRVCFLVIDSFLVALGIVSSIFNIYLFLENAH